MESLCKNCLEIKLADKRWFPKPVNLYENLVARKMPTKEKGYLYGLRKNICYNLQYLEYVDKTIKELELTTVLTTMSYKIFVVISASIIEGILYHEVKSQKLESKSFWGHRKK
jgi:hypothetical protein